jgi:hypothetical protein
MAVLAIFTGDGITRSMYESLRREVKRESQQPAGGLLHACGFDEKGNLHVADVWESAEAMGAFVDGRLLPAMKRLGVPPPSVAVYPAHNVNVHPGAAKEHLLR